MAAGSDIFWRRAMCLVPASRGSRFCRPGLHILDHRALGLFATVFGLMPDSLLSRANEACDRCIAVLTACVVVALP